MTEKTKDVAKRQLTIDLPTVLEASPPPIINIEPVINIPAPEPRPYTARVTQRDANGFILEFVIVPDPSP
jgi:hypothetical protein